MHRIEHQRKDQRDDLHIPSGRSIQAPLDAFEKPIMECLRFDLLNRHDIDGSCLTNAVRIVSLVY